MTRPTLRELPDVVDRRTLVDLFAQLVVVFLGVYAAFLLDGWRQDRAEAERRRQVHAALLTELRGSLDNVENFLSTGRPFLESFRSAVEAGERPPLEPVHGGVRFTPHMWNATLETAGLEILDVDLVYDISAFYNNVEMATLRLDLLRRYSRDVLLPNLHRPADEFYEEDGSLRPKYRWYLQYWGELVRRSEDLVDRGEKLIRKLERRLGDADAADAADTLGTAAVVTPGLSETPVEEGRDRRWASRPVPARRILTTPRGPPPPKR